MARFFALFACATVWLVGCPDKPSGNDGVSLDVGTSDVLVIDDMRDVPANTLIDRADAEPDASNAAADGGADDANADGGFDAFADAATSMDGNAASDVLPVGVGVTPPDPDDPDRFNTIAQPDPRFENIRGTVVFKNNDPVPYENEDLYGDPNIEPPLETLGRLVRERSCGTLALRVTENFDSLREHTGGSTHFEGRGIDLTLAETLPGGAMPPVATGIYTAGYGRLARLANEG